MTDSKKRMIAVIAIAISVVLSFVIDLGVNPTAQYLDNKIEQVENISGELSFSDYALGGISVKEKAIAIASVASIERHYVSTVSVTLFRYVLPIGILLYLLVISIKKFNFAYMRSVAVCIMVVSIAFSFMIPVSLGIGAFYGAVAPDPADKIQQQYEENVSTSQNSEDGFMSTAKNWVKDKKNEITGDIKEKRMENNVAKARLDQIKAEIVTIPGLMCLVLIIGCCAFTSRWIHKRKERDLKKKIGELQAQLEEAKSNANDGHIEELETDAAETAEYVNELVEKVSAKEESKGLKKIKDFIKENLD
ncbi:MAG: hypothetical protein MJ146_04480 [Clostridia bacterium]|nr:hypothetical protein [Clostridia bacterium]